MELVPPNAPTAISTVPADPAGAVAVSWLVELTVTAVALTPPKYTKRTPMKFDPLIVTLLPPTAGPADGLTLVTVGGAGRSACTGTVRQRQANSTPIQPRDSMVTLDGMNHCISRKSFPQVGE